MRNTPPNHYWASTVRDSWLDVPWGIGCIFVSPNPHEAVGYMKQKPAIVWPMDLAPCSAKHHAKRDRRCQSTNSGRLMTPWLKSCWFQTVSNCSCWQTLFEYGTGCEWHPSNQTLQCPVIMIRPMVCRILASLSHCWFVCVFSPVCWIQYSGSSSDVQ